MKLKKLVLLCLSIWLICTSIAGCEYLAIENAEYGFAREVPEAEKQIRLQVVQTAEAWLGCKESDGSHEPIVDLYNSHSPLAMDYTVKYTDEWCATFGSAVAIKCGLTDIIPTECGCERQIKLFMEKNCWQEDDAYVPLPGDYIFYSLKNKDSGDCTAWADHVGIVVGTWTDYIKVIEGNNAETVRYRFIKIDDTKIRGFALPDYASIPEPTETTP